MTGEITHTHFGEDRILSWPSSVEFSVGSRARYKIQWGNVHAVFMGEDESLEQGSVSTLSDISNSGRHWAEYSLNDCEGECSFAVGSKAFAVFKVPKSPSDRANQNPVAMGVVCANGTVLLDEQTAFTSTAIVAMLAAGGAGLILLLVGQLAFSVAALFGSLGGLWIFAEARWRRLKNIIRNKVGIQLRAQQLNATPAASSRPPAFGYAVSGQDA